eukprot:scaffold91_cov254-Pinguiococcus_pyrenoidosus.AAC.28
MSNRGKTEARDVSAAEASETTGHAWSSNLRREGLEGVQARFLRRRQLQLFGVEADGVLALHHVHFAVDPPRLALLSGVTTALRRRSRVLWRKCASAFTPAVRRPQPWPQQACAGWPSARVGLLTRARQRERRRDAIGANRKQRCPKTAFAALALAEREK